MAAATKMNSQEIESWLTAIASMSREELIEQFHTYPAPFPVDFTDAFLRSQPVDKLRHVFAGLVLHCRVEPRVAAHAA
jgi:hypothetical protein